MPDAMRTDLEEMNFPGPRGSVSNSMIWSCVSAPTESKDLRPTVSATRMTTRCASRSGIAPSTSNLALLDETASLEVGEFGVADTELAQNLVRVLPDDRRRPIDRRLRFAHLDRWPDHLHGACLRMLVGRHEAAMPDLWIIGHL